MLTLVAVVHTETAHLIGCKGLILEMSTPFSGICWTLLKAGLERSVVWKANQLVLVHTFHLRNVAEVMLWVITWRDWDNIRHNMPVPLLAVLYTNLFLITVFMTPYWTYKKTQQLFSPVDWNFEGVKPGQGDIGVTSVDQGGRGMKKDV